jgi:Zn-dependent protease with chaperone function
MQWLGTPLGKRNVRRVSWTGWLLAALLIMAGPLAARVNIKPGFNTFTPTQDVELGKEASREVEKEFTLVRDTQISDYVSRLGQKLARYAPGEKFPYHFQVIQNKDINAFALPGGPVYIHSAILTSAANEGQLAGVMAHEISHIALRHSTNQASKQMLAQAPLAILGGVLSGGGGLAGQLAQLGIAFGLNSAFLKFSRDAERQADQLGAQILYDAGYDPQQMALFFETLEKESGSRSVEFFSSHPNPGNRRQDVAKLIPSLGPSRQYALDSSEFDQVKRRAQSLGDAPSGPRGQSSTPAARPSTPSRNFRLLDAGWFSVSYPDNWEVYGEGTSAITLVPPEGIVQVGQNDLPAIAYGALVSVFEPLSQGGRRPSLRAATDQLLYELQRSNPNLRVTSSAKGLRISNQQGLSVMATGESPLAGEAEANWIVTTYRTEGLWYVVFIAPQASYSSWQAAFQRMLETVRFPR